MFLMSAIVLYLCLSRTQSQRHVRTNNSRPLPGYICLFSRQSGYDKIVYYHTKSNYPRLTTRLVMTDLMMTHCRTQLQLVGAVCLLVSWKVRGHSPITAQRLIEYTDYTITLPDLLVSLESFVSTSLLITISLSLSPHFVSSHQHGTH